MKSLKNLEIFKNTLEYIMILMFTYVYIYRHVGYIANININLLINSLKDFLTY